MDFVDTHCHIQFADYGLEPETVISDAIAAGVTRLICVGCGLPDSEAAINFAARHTSIWASIGLHPHEASRYVHDHHALQAFRNLVAKPRVVAVGETGLDYYYTHSPKDEQEKLLRFQLELALEYNLPLIFHIREAFTDFWRIHKDYRGVTGVVHSFSSNKKDLDEVLSRGLYIGLNGIMTFSGKEDQLAAAKSVPLERLVLETDAPFLTPAPLRGKINEPKHVCVTAEFLANLRGEDPVKLAAATTANAITLFKLL